MAEYFAHLAGHQRSLSGGTEPMTSERFQELLREYGAPTPSIRKPKPDA